MESLPEVRRENQLLQLMIDGQRLMMEEQKRTNELLLMLIEAMGQEDSGDPDAPPAYYMDGSPVRG